MDKKSNGDKVMFNFKPSALALSLGLLIAPMLANAKTISQTFDSSWTVGVWNYYGAVSALQWQYIPYAPWSPSLGTLTSVAIDTVISGTRVDSLDPVHIRESLITGWSPDAYQYYADYFIPAGKTSFTWDQKQIFSSQTDLANVTNYQYFTGNYNQGSGTGGAWYYFESSTLDAAHSINAVTTLVYNFSPAAAVPEPETYAMLFVGLGLMGFIVRRRKA